MGCMVGGDGSASEKWATGWREEGRNQHKVMFLKCGHEKSSQEKYHNFHSKS